MNIGDKILFNNYTSSNTIPGFRANPEIPRNLIIHGCTVQKDAKDGGIIEAFHKNYVIISYTDEIGNKVQLGFLPKSFTVVNQDPEKVSYEIY